MVTSRKWSGGRPLRCRSSRRVAFNPCLPTLVLPAAIASIPVLSPAMEVVGMEDEVNPGDRRHGPELRAQRWSLWSGANAKAAIPWRRSRPHRFKSQASGSSNDTKSPPCPGSDAIHSIEPIVSVAHARALATGRDRHGSPVRLENDPRRCLATSGYTRARGCHSFRTDTRVDSGKPSA